MQLGSLVPITPGSSFTSASCSSSATAAGGAAVTAAVRLCDDSFSYTNSSIGTGDTAAELMLSPDPTDAEEDAEDVEKKTAKKVGLKRLSNYISDDVRARPTEFAQFVCHEFL